jgi:hypothetical protein
LCTQNQIIAMLYLVLKVGIGQLRRSVHIDQHDPCQSDHCTRPQKLGYDFQAEIETGREGCSAKDARLLGDKHFRPQSYLRITIAKATGQPPGSRGESSIE